MEYTIHNTRPSDVNTSQHFFETFGNEAKEDVARQIVLFLLNHDNQWVEFTFEEYKRINNLDSDEHWNVFNNFVRDNFMAFEDGYYCVTNLFIQAISKFIKEKPAESLKDLIMQLPKPPEGIEDTLNNRVIYAIELIKERKKLEDKVDELYKRVEKAFAEMSELIKQKEL